MHVRWRWALVLATVTTVCICLFGEVKSRAGQLSTVRRKRQLQQRAPQSDRIKRLLKTSEENEEKTRSEEGEEKSEKAGLNPAGEEDALDEEEEKEDPILQAKDLTLAICLLGCVIFIMLLYHCTNYKDPDMRFYVWSVISTTISVFIAVFTFTSIQVTLVEVFLKNHASNSGLILIGVCQLAFYFSCVQFSIAYVSGAWEEKPFDEGSSFEKQKEKREIGFKSLATLFAHMCAFAAINFGGTLQHMPPFNASVGTRYLVAPTLFAGQLILVRICRLARREAIQKIRHHHHLDKEGSYGPLIRDDVDKEGIEWCLHMWDSETYECECEIASLCISFLLVQACRFNITGVMPDTMGVEEEDYTHPQIAVYQLFGLSGFFAVISMCLVVGLSYLPQKIDAGSPMSIVKRCLDVGEQTFAVGCAWCMLFAGRWQMAILTTDYPPNGVISRVLLALIISGVTFFIVVILDCIADSESTAPVADQAIFALIRAFSFLVGFTWEQSFDGAVEVLADLCFKEHRIAAQLVLAFIIILVVYPAWRIHILHKMLKLKEKRSRREVCGEVTDAEPLTPRLTGVSQE